MNMKRLLPWVLALVLALPALALPASAATFPDIQDHWAKSYIELMTAQGMFKGYDDGNFKPENALTAAEALALCARATGLDDTTEVEIYNARMSDVTSILNGSQSWFQLEFAVCLETGILTTAELRSLTNSGALSQPIAKEDLAVYLARAMQLGPMSERLSSYPLSFSDTSSISEEARPSVYLLNTYGIVEGDQNNDFEPDRDVTRAVMATMLSRALQFMDTHGTSPDLPDYTDYDFQQGVIAASPTESSSGSLLLTLKSDLTGETLGTVTLPADVTIYENSMETTTSALKAGRHARVCLSSSGKAYAVRVSEALEELDVTVSDIEDNTLTVRSGGTTYTFEMDRFTQVKIGSRITGDRSIVDPEGGYTDAVCKLDDQGRLVAILFSGGTESTEGVLTSYIRGTNGADPSILVTGLDGVIRTYVLGDDASVTIDGMVGTLNGSYVGDYVVLHISNEDDHVLTAVVDTASTYVQGSVKSVTSSSNNKSVTVTNLSTNKSTNYKVANDAVITYEGEEVALRSIKEDYFVTLRVSDKTANMVAAYPGSSSTEGTITNRTFETGSDAQAIFELTLRDGSKVNFRVDLSDPPVVKRDGDTTTIDKLRTGDYVTVTVRYNEVTRIEAEAQTANVVGTVERIIQEVSGSTLELTLTTGEQVSYTVGSGISVTQDGDVLSLSSIRPGYRLGLVVSDDDQVVSIEIQQSANSSNKVTGTVIYVNTDERYVYLQVTGESGAQEIITVYVPSTSTILEVKNGNSLYLRELDSGDTIEANGSYSGGAFYATVVLKQ